MVLQGLMWKTHYLGFPVISIVPRCSTGRLPLRLKYLGEDIDEGVHDYLQSMLHSYQICWALHRQC